MSKLIANWIFNRNSAHYKVFYSISGILNIEDMIKYLSIRFKYAFIRIDRNQPIEHLMRKMITCDVYLNDSMTYNIYNHEFTGFEDGNFNKPVHEFSLLLNNYKLEKLKYGVNGNMIQCRSKNGMDKVLKISSPEVRAKLISWRRQKLFFNTVIIENNKPFNRLTFNIYIYPKIKSRINTKILSIYEGLDRTDNYTIVDYMINLSKFEDAIAVIDMIRSYLKPTNAIN